MLATWSPGHYVNTPRPAPPTPRRPSPSPRSPPGAAARPRPEPAARGGQGAPGGSLAGRGTGEGGAGPPRAAAAERERPRRPPAAAQAPGPRAPSPAGGTGLGHAYFFFRPAPTNFQRRGSARHSLFFWRPLCKPVFQTLLDILYNQDVPVCCLQSGGLLSRTIKPLSAIVSKFVPWSDFNALHVDLSV